MKNRNKNYLNNEKLYPVLMKSKRLGRVTPELGKMFLILVDRYSEHPWWSGYSDNWKTEMKSEAILALVKGALKFDPSHAESRGKKPNPFAYCTTIVYRAFKSSRDKDKKQEKIEELLPYGLY